MDNFDQGLMSQGQRPLTTLTHPEHGEQLNIHSACYRLLKERFDKTSEIFDFLSWDLKKLPELTNLIDLKKASLRIIEAIAQQEKIGIHGDYDVDGTTSAALLFHFFQMIGVNVETFQPSRFVDGYGVHPASVDLAKEKGVKVLITVDCGITNVKTAEYALEQNIDLIITDHHKDAAEVIPPAFAVVNPNRRDETEHGLNTLAGVGVAFALALQIKNDLESEGNKTPSLYPLLQFVALGTICDLATLGPTNLKLCRHGIKQFASTQYEGLKAFLTKDELERKHIESEKLSFQIGPMINSKGRLEHPEMALNLLKSHDLIESKEIHHHLYETNQTRKDIQKKVFEEAKKEVLDEHPNGPSAVSMVYRPHWHEGVIGIVASKLVETFRVAALVFSDAEEKGIIKASCRGAGDINLFDLLNEQSDLFIKFGGHHKAAGLSMKKENFPLLKKRLTQALEKFSVQERTEKERVDLNISIHDVGFDLVKSLDLMEPFGQGNPKPIFRIDDMLIEQYQILKGQHVKWFFKARNKQGIMDKSVNGISFFYMNQFNKMHPDQLMEKQEDGLSVDCSLGINHFRGRQYLQLMVNKIRSN